MAEQRSRQAVACADAGQANRNLGMGMSLAQLAEVYRQQGRLADAEPIYRQNDIRADLPPGSYRA